MIPGEWAGSVVLSTTMGVGICCTQEKWERAKAIIAKFHEGALKGLPLGRKDSEQKRGFLFHIQRTYPAITPYLKGLHQTIGWRPNIDEEGWKLGGSQGSRNDPGGYWDEEVGELISWEVSSSAAPVYVSPVPRLTSDMTSL